MKTILVTGGCGFIGSHFVRLLCSERSHRVVNLDKLTYAGNLVNVTDITGENHPFVNGDICDQDLLNHLVEKEKPWAIINFAAESHVDRSILDAKPFLETNILGVQSILESIRKFPVKRFIQISTDEVYGDRSGKESASEQSPVSPSSPYAVSKAAADLLCFAYHRTYGLPIIVTRSSNNYGPYQLPEKLIPLLIRNALNDMPLPIYGDGKQMRDWLFVEDNCRAILGVLRKGQIGSIYNIGTTEERTNLDVVEAICKILSERKSMPLDRLRERVESVADRPGHDRRYAIESSKIRQEIGWKPTVNFVSGLTRTVDWYLSHSDWVSGVISGEYRNYYDSVYGRTWNMRG